MQNILDRLNELLGASLPSLLAALAFGLGGREVAGRQLDSWVRSVRGPE